MCYLRNVFVFIILYSNCWVTSSECFKIWNCYKIYLTKLKVFFFIIFLEHFLEIFHITDLGRYCDSLSIFCSNYCIVSQCIIGNRELFTIKQITTGHNSCSTLGYYILFINYFSSFTMNSCYIFFILFNPCILKNNLSNFWNILIPCKISISYQMGEVNDHRKGTQPLYY